MPEQGEYAYMATVEALANARMDQDYIDSKEVGILYGNDSCAEAVIHGIDVMREKKDTMLVGSGSVFQTMNSTVTMNLATIFKLRGVNFTVSAACASGSHAIGLGYHFIKSGLQECVICGGAQEVNKYSMGNFDALSAFSVREAEPVKASRPFDRDRDGNLGTDAPNDLHGVVFNHRGGLTRIIRNTVNIQFQAVDASFLQPLSEIHPSPGARSI